MIKNARILSQPSPTHLHHSHLFRRGLCALMAGCLMQPGPVMAAPPDTATSPAPRAPAGGPPQIRVEPTAPSLRPAIALNSNTGGNGVGTGSSDREQWETFLDQVSVRNVTSAALYPVLPARPGNGEAVIVVPGGGYRFVSIESEGFRVAEALAAAGYAAFVLKYRTVPTARDIPTYLDDTMQLFANLGKGTLADNQPAVDDLARAIRYVRGHAETWHIDQAKVSVIGFSAGSRTAIRLLENKPEAADLHSVALLYPPMTQTVQPGPRPPLFLAIAGDDPLFRQGGLGLVEAWLTQSPKVEFHLYSGGSHGFGMRPNGTTADLWIGQYLAWLARH